MTAEPPAADPGGPAAAATVGAAGSGAAAAPAPHASAPPGRATVAVAGAAVMMIGTRIDLPMSLTLGTVAGLALAPVWLPVLRQYRGARLLGVLVALCVALGLWLTELAATSRGTSTNLLEINTALLVGVVVCTGVILWARTLMRDASVAVLYGVGLVLGINPGGRFAENPWRFGFSVPVTILVLAVCWLVRRLWLQVVAALALATTSGLNDGRSMFAMLLLVAVLTAWQISARSLRAPASRARIIVLASALAYGVYSLGQGLILDGYLGESTQQRTAAQIEVSGSMLLGARPELGATLALMQLRPYGYGSGSLATFEDLVTAKRGMAALGYDPDNGYVERYMFGAGVELHSVIGDLWVAFGFAGLALAAFIGWRVVHRVSGDLAQRAAAALLLFLAIRTTWDLFFSPLFSSVTLLPLTLGLMLLRRTDAEPDGSPPAPAEAARRP